MTEKDFIEWVIDEIMDEEFWELNHGSFTELACRKLVKLGYLTKKDGHYVSVEKKQFP